MDTLEPVPVKKTLLIINTFIVNSAAFLNKFVSTCDSKLHRINSNIEKMEITLQILEGKLSSIDWLREAEAGKAPNIPQLDDMKDIDFVHDDQNSNNNNRENDDSVPVQPNEDPMLSDPKYSEWIKMLKVGVPAPGVRNKMLNNGYTEDAIKKLISLLNK